MENVEEDFGKRNMPVAQIEDSDVEFPAMKQFRLMTEKECRALERSWCQVNSSGLDAFEAISALLLTLESLQSRSKSEMYQPRLSSPDNGSLMMTNWSLSSIGQRIQDLINNMNQLLIQEAGHMGLHMNEADNEANTFRYLHIYKAIPKLKDDLNHFVAVLNQNSELEITRYFEGMDMLSLQLMHPVLYHLSGPVAFQVDTSDGELGYFRQGARNPLYFNKELLHLISTIPSSVQCLRLWISQSLFRCLNGECSPLSITESNHKEMLQCISEIGDIHTEVLSTSEEYFQERHAIVSRSIKCPTAVGKVHRVVTFDVYWFNQFCIKMSPLMYKLQKLAFLILLRMK